MTDKKYILDTNIVTYLYQRDALFHDAVEKEIRKANAGDKIFVSVLTLFEIRHGLAISGNLKTKTIFENLILAIKRDFLILPLLEKDSFYFGLLKAEYMKHTGITKDAAKRHDIDFMLAGSAMAENATLVSNDRLFEKISLFNPAFRFKNWAERHA